MAPTKTGPVRQQIGPMKARVVKHLKEGKELLTEEVPIDGKRQDVLDQMQLAHDNVEKSSKKLQAKHDEWVELLLQAADEQEHYDKASEEIVNLLLDCDDLITALTSRIKRENSRSLPPTPSVPAVSPAASVAITDNQARVNVDTSGAAVQRQPNPQQHQPARSFATAFKVPKIKLPIFRGDYTEFKQFWGIFEANIHSRPDLSNVEKFTYLLSQVEGQAKQTLAGVLITEENYETAVTLLKSRFDRADERIISMLYSQFMQVATCKNKTADKMKTLDECERIFRQLETAGEDVNSNKSLVCGLLSKFPTDMVKDLQRYYKVGPSNTLKEVREGLSSAIKEEESTADVIGDLQAMRVKEKEAPEKSGGNSSSEAKVYHNSALASMTQSKPRKPAGPQMLRPPSNCYFCGGDHFIRNCEAYPTARKRIERLRALGRCTRCLRSHPNFKGKCTNEVRCVYCHTNNSHSSALCYRQYPDHTSPQQASQTSQNQSRASGAVPDNGQPQNSAAGTATGTSTAPIFQTAQAQGASSHANQTVTAGNGPATNGGITALNHINCKPTLFQTAKTTAVNPKTGQSCSVRLAMDTLSSRCYIRERVAKQLGLIGEKCEHLYVSVFGTSKTLDLQTARVEFQVKLRDGSLYDMDANTTKVISQAGVMLNNWTDEESRALSYFQASLADDPYDSDGTIDILVGSSVVWHLIDGPRMPTTTPNLFLIPSKLGLLLGGESQKGQNQQTTMLCLTESPCCFPSELGMISAENKQTPSYPDIDEFWTLEKIGIADDPSENEDDKALDNFRKTVMFEAGRYQVTLPWIEEKKDRLPTNYEVAYDRLRSLTKRLKTETALLQGYRDVMKTQLDKGIIEKVPDGELENKFTIHYLPHHAVVKPSSATTKVRVVFDASARRDRHSSSLNECLMRGPVILPDLCQLLMRMRTFEIVVTSDIEKAFLQVGLQVHERDVTRFLWLKNDTTMSLTENVQVYRFTRVNFGVISSPFLLAATLDHHLTQENSDFAESLRDDIYVDNVISGLNAGSDTLKYYNDLKALFQRAGMNIQEFCSNDHQFMTSIPKNDRVKQTSVKLLGLKWESEKDDTLQILRSSKLDDSQNASKRTVLQAIASMFDPLGFFQPVLLPAKFFLKKLWEKQYDWDDPLPSDLQNEWTVLLDCLLKLSEHRIPRFVGTVTDESTLVIFSDASAGAYATTVYLRTRAPDGKWKAELIFSKSRLTPTPKKKEIGTQVTLPRLELLGALIGVRAAIFCRKALKNDEMRVDFFIDSQCVLQWLRSRGVLKRFVANRIDEMRKIKNAHFHYVSTTENPADFSTRGKLPDELFESQLWWKGPEWLKEDVSQWSEQLPQINDQTFEDIRVEQRTIQFSHALPVIKTAEPCSSFLSINPRDHSTLNKLIRVSFLVLKFLREKVWRKLSAESRTLHPALEGIFDVLENTLTLESDSYRMIMNCWIRNVQNVHFSAMTEDILKGVVNNFPIIQQLGLGLDQDGFIRAQGRYKYADLPEETLSPILLPKGDPFTVLIVNDIHSSSMHSGISHTLCQIRLKFWIPHGRALVRQVLGKCLVCRKYKTGRPFKLPPMPPWPKDRVTRSKPFQNIGLDYFGPVTVKIADERRKMWVCLFTCLAVRAVHLEPVMDCSAIEFLQCLIRFVNRRGTPSTIISDNASQFRLTKLLGDQAWQHVTDDSGIANYTAKSGIKWKFITELAPWQGGFYERLVGIVKSTLRMSIRSKLLSWTDFITLLTDAEATVNMRPLTYLNDDINSTYRVLRPSDFLFEADTSLGTGQETVSAKDFGEAGKRLVAIWKQRCRTLDRFWRLWYEDYLLSLRERSITAHKSNRSDLNKRPTLNQVILLWDSDVPRGVWKLAKIIKLFPGNDGQVRSAEIQLSNGVKLRRPINHLIPLEVENTEERGEDDAARSLPDFDDSTDFQGFSGADVQRTIDALQRYD